MTRAAVTRPCGTECTAAIPVGTTMKNANTTAKMTFCTMPMPNISTNTGRSTDFGTVIRSCKGPPRTRLILWLSPMMKPIARPSGATMTKATRHSNPVTFKSARNSSRPAADRPSTATTLDKGGIVRPRRIDQTDARQRFPKAPPTRRRCRSGRGGPRYFADGWKSLLENAPKHRPWQVQACSRRVPQCRVRCRSGFLDTAVADNSLMTWLVELRVELLVVRFRELFR